MTHKHDWKTKFINIEWKDHISGMICECGESLSQDEVVDIVNKHLGTFAQGGVLTSGNITFPLFGECLRTITISQPPIGETERERMTEIILEAFADEWSL